MSKKYKGKTCAYCCEAPSTAEEHVLARGFILPERRRKGGEMPKAPACDGCNGTKSDLENYLMKVMALGGRHDDAREYLEQTLPRRLEKDQKLHRQLQRGASRALTRELSGIVLPTTAVPFEMAKLADWLEFVVKGLAWHHWAVLIDKTIEVNSHDLQGPWGPAFDAFWRGTPEEQRLPLQDIGAGTFRTRRCAATTIRR
jgi:hypothetical protein